MIALAAAVSGALALSAASDMDEFKPADERHAACLAGISENAETGYEDALAWRHMGGGWPAEHCVSLALMALGENEAGAARLRAAAEGAITATPESRALMFGQAGDGYMAAGLFEEAASAFERAADFAPEDSGMALGRAKAALALEDHAQAEEWGVRAASLNPERAEAYVVVGNARLAQRDLDGAESAMRAGREVAPENIDLLLLRGAINEARRTGQVVTLD
ncbi:MAG: hypothetical protein ABL308_02460 [Oceanicaulis sp.]